MFFWEIEKIIFGEIEVWAYVDGLEAEIIGSYDLDDPYEYDEALENHHDDLVDSITADDGRLKIMVVKENG